MLSMVGVMTMHIDSSYIRPATVELGCQLGPCHSAQFSLKGDECGLAWSVP